MSAFSERLAAAKAAPKKTSDVTVALNDDLSEEREALKADLAAARAKHAEDDRLAAADSAGDAIQEQLDSLLERTADSLATFRFTRLPGDAWAEITARCPVRLDAPLDRAFGYDMHKAAKLAARYVDPAGKPFGVLIEDGAEVQLTVTPTAEGVPAVDEWGDMFAQISGYEMTLIIDTIYALNMAEPAKNVDSLVKSLATRRA